MEKSFIEVNNMMSLGFLESKGLKDGVPMFTIIPSAVIYQRCYQPQGRMKRLTGSEVV